MAGDISEIRKKLDVLRKRIETEDNLEDHLPSHYWMEYTELFDYVFSLRDEVVVKIRHHTDMLTSSHPHQYHNAIPEFRKRIIDSYKLIKSKLPSLSFTEPELAGGFGFTHSESGNEVLVNQDLVRYMEVFEKLSENEVLHKKYNMILEIGGGFGGLAAQFINNYPETKYLIVDLPYTLYFSAAYLSQVFPKSRIYIHSGGEELPLAEYDIFLLPPWGIESIPEKSVELAINQASLGEMTEWQVNYYLKNIDRVTSGLFISYNRKFHNPWNKELGGLTEKISKVFRTKRDRREVKPAFKERVKLFVKRILLTNIMKPVRLMLERLRGRRIIDGAVGNVYMWVICEPK